MVDTSRQFVYGCASLWEVIEQIDLLNNDNVLSTHVFGLGIDDEVSYRIEGLATPEDYWPTETGRLAQRDLVVSCGFEGAT